MNDAKSALSAQSRKALYKHNLQLTCVSLPGSDDSNSYKLRRKWDQWCVCIIVPVEPFWVRTQAKFLRRAVVWWNQCRHATDQLIAVPAHISWYPSTYPRELFKVWKSHLFVLWEQHWWQNVTVLSYFRTPCEKNLHSILKENKSINLLIHSFFHFAFISGNSKIWNFCVSWTNAVKARTWNAALKDMGYGVRIHTAGASIYSLCLE